MLQVLEVDIYADSMSAIDVMVCVGQTEVKLLRFTDDLMDGDNGLK